MKQDHRHHNTFIQLRSQSIPQLVFQLATKYLVKIHRYLTINICSFVASAAVLCPISVRMSLHLLGLFLAATLLVLVRGHGRLIEPPSRSSMWRFGFKTEPNYNDNELFCGGFTLQYQSNNGKCGICGDAYNLPQPRPNEAGGKYGQGIIVRHYNAGQVLRTTVELTANHQGYFQFRLCPNNNPRKIATQECLDQYPLSVVGGDSKYYVPTRFPGFFDVDLQLPPGLTCTQCVFQWIYTSGNNWGNCGNGTSKVGCGPQETFRGCADVDIGQADFKATDIPKRPTKPITFWLQPLDWSPDSDATTTSTTTTVQPEVPSTTTEQPKVPSTTTAQPEVPSTTTAVPEVPSTTTAVPEVAPPTTTEQVATTEVIVITRPPKIPGKRRKNHKTTKRPRKPTKKPSTPVEPQPIKEATACRSAGAYASVPGMDNWCTVNCQAGFCPASHCSCT